MFWLENVLFMAPSCGAPGGLWLRVRNCALRGGSAPWRTIAAWVLGSLAPFALGGGRRIGHVLVARGYSMFSSRH